MHRKLFALLFLLVSSFSFVFAQEEDEDWFWDKTITKIEFEGLRHVKKSELVGITSSFIDKPFTQDVYSDLLDRLYALDFFEDIVPYAKHDTKNYDDVLLVFLVTENPIIRSINFSGNIKIRNGELREQIKIKPSDIYSNEKVLMAERMLRNYYVQKGFSNSQVTHKVVESDGDVVLTFYIDEGYDTVVKKISIVGNTLFSERMIKSKLALKEVGFLKDGAFQNAVLEQDKMTILDYYKERGYVDVAILDTKIESVFNDEKKQNELFITFYIQEGAQYTYGGLTITGNEIFSTKELERCEKLKVGAIYNEIKFQEGIMEIASLYMNNGYMSASIVPVPIKDSEHHVISYDLRITENSRAHVENIIIKGNNKTKEYVIKREIPIEEGDVFSRDKIISAYRNLMNLQYFGNVIPEPQQGSEKDLVDVVFSVEEQSTTSLQFGMTFSQSSDPQSLPISLFTKWENSNLFGEGRSISGSLSLSTSEQSLDFTYSQNWIGNIPLTFSSSLAVSHAKNIALMNMWLPNGSLNQNLYYMSYESFSASFSNSLFRRWYTDYAILSAGFGLSNSLINNVYDQNLYVPVDYTISHYANRWGLSNSVFLTGSIDNRDINYFPKKGWFLSERLSWTGLIPGVEKEFYLKSDTKLEGYFTLVDIPLFDEKWNFTLVLAGYSGVTGIFPAIAGSVSDSSKLYVDGMFNGRGWTDVYKSTRGLAMFSNKLELRMPLVPNMIGIDGFFDACAVKPTVADLFSDLTLQDFYFSFGPSVRFLLPQFPLSLVFAWRFTSEGWADVPFQFVLSFNIINR